MGTVIPDTDVVWISFLLFLSGSSIFSFLNVVIYRTPLQMDIVKEPSRCTKCGHALSFSDMIPVVGWFLLRGKCRYCQARISARYPMIELLGGIAALLCIRKWGVGWRALLVYVFLAMLTVIAFVDMDTLKIPNTFVLIVGAISGLSIPFFPEISMTERILGIFSVSILLLAVAILVPKGFGGGDIKLMAACGLFLGWKQSLTAFLLAVAAAGTYCIWMLFMKKMTLQSKLAFGSFLCLGMAAALFL